jgi:hypothetical protein
LIKNLDRNDSASEHLERYVREEHLPLYHYRNNRAQHITVVKTTPEKNMNNVNKFVHRAIRQFYTAIDTHPMAVTVATVGTTTFCGIVLFSVLEYLEIPRHENDTNDHLHHRKLTAHNLDNDNKDVDGYNGNSQDKEADVDGLYLGHRTAGEHYSKHAPRPTMTLERARLQAMIENAKESTWKENIANATFAQERFMLPGRYHPDDDNDYVGHATTNGGSSGNNNNNSTARISYPKNNFMKKIDERSREIMQQHEAQLELEREKEKRRKLTTKFW